LNLGITIRMDKRNFQRFNVNVAVRYRILESLAIPKVSQTEDMSEGGIRMTLSEYVRPETRLELTIHIPSQPWPIMAIGRVVWVKPESLNKQFITGIQLTYIRQKDKKLFYQYALS